MHVRGPNLPSVHFHEIELRRIVIVDELHGPGAKIVDRFRGCNSLINEIRPDALVEPWCWSLQVRNLVSQFLFIFADIALASSIIF